MKIGTISRIYLIPALAGAVAFSGLAYSFAPVILLAWYLFQWRWPLSPPVGLATLYFLYFALAVLYAQFIPPYLAVLVSIPALPALLSELEKSASQFRFNGVLRRRWFTPLALFMLGIDLAVMLLSYVIPSITLSISAAVVLFGMAGLGVYLVRRFPSKPVREEVQTRRILAGKEEPFSFKLEIKTSVGGALWLKPGAEWVKVSPKAASLKSRAVSVEGRITPPLAGSSTVRFEGLGVDRWGLMQVRFDVEPLKLEVIPRARYAVWLAQKYLSGSKPGALPLLSSLNAINATRGLRQGIEFYGNRDYQAGDNLKNIDWKHSVKYDELIVKEFFEFRGSPALMLINLAVKNAEEADRLVYNIVVTAITLSQAGIPAAMAVYNQAKTVLNTTTLSASELLLSSLRIIKDVVFISSPVKYLSGLDVARLRASATRLSHSSGQAAGILSQLMQIEYKTISRNAHSSPCSEALSLSQARLTEQPTVLILSQRNHDAEALAFNTYRLAQKGIAVIDVR